MQSIRISGANVSDIGFLPGRTGRRSGGVDV